MSAPQPLYNQPSGGHVSVRGFTNTTTTGGNTPQAIYGDRGIQPYPPQRVKNPDKLKPEPPRQGKRESSPTRRSE